MNVAAVEAKFQQALAFHERGQLGEAELICREILTLAPDNVDALHLLGMLEGQRGNAAGAIEWISQAIRINPNDASAHSNIGVALLELERFEEALASFDRALTLEPDYAVALNGRGIGLQGLKRHKEALANFDRALRQQPDYVDALNNRGNALLDLKRPEEALASFDRALKYQPDHADTLNNRGIALLDLKRLEEALASYDGALAIRPAFANAIHNRASALWKLRRREEALASWVRVLAIEPNYANALYRRGIALGELKRYEESIADLKKLLAINPLHDYARGWLLHMQLYCCEWADYSQSAAQIAEGVRAGRRADSPLSFQVISDSAADQFRCSRVFAADNYPAASQAVWRGERYRHGRIRLAYLSADFRVHPSSFLLAGMFEHHDRKRFETIAISFGHDDQSEIRSRLKAAFEHFIDVRRRSDLEVAHLMRELEVDIAVDLMGYTQNGRMGILALRPAPIQVNYLGCPGTTGADYIDYILADRIVIPEPHHPYYVEKVVYLPDTYLVNDSKRVIADRTPTRAEAGLPEQGFVFCSFNNSHKISPAVFDVWIRLLAGVERSVLWLRAETKDAMGNLRKEAAHRGIVPERLVFAPRAERIEEHLARHRLADLALDTLPYNGHATTSDALWTGLPVVTCMGTTFPGRVAASMLYAIGLPELVTHSLEEYEALALELATNRKRLADIKSKLAQNRGTYALFDTDRFRRHIEAAYTTMWDRYQKGEPPESFAVQRIQ